MKQVESFAMRIEEMVNPGAPTSQEAFEASVLSTDNICFDEDGEEQNVGQAMAESIEDVICRRQLYACAKRTLNTLPKMQRKIFWLRHMKDLTIEEVADTLELDCDRVVKLDDEAIRIMRKELESFC